MNSAPKFIVVEGIDGSGKTTVIKKIVELLTEKNIEVIVGKGIGSGPLGEAARTRLFTGNKPSEDLEVFALSAGLLDCFESFVKPNLEQGKVVILDRYYPSLYAYQYSGRDNLLVKDIVKKLFIERKDRKADLVFHCSIGVEKAEERLNSRGKENYLDEEDFKFKRRVKEGYENIFRDYFNNVHTIHTAHSLEVTFAQVKSSIDVLFKG